MRLSRLYAPTLREDPAEAEIESHRLLLRAGMIRKVAAGIYTFLPLGYRVFRKVEGIVREEMERAGAQELMMPALQPAELWQRSGRWDEYGPELMRLKDRASRDFCLGPTHEELITSTVAGELRSYKQLPVNLFQIQVKFRDEVRPRFGLLRGREFMMKDAYSFHATQESLEETYELMVEAYGRICTRCGLTYRPVEAHSGLIGGKVTIEFMALAETGEAELVFCPAAGCEYAANVEAGEGIVPRTPATTERALQKVHTPAQASIAQVAAFLGVPESETVKTMAAVSGRGDDAAVFFMIPGDRDLNELKAHAVSGGGRLLGEDEFETHGLVKGFLGPVGAPEGVRLVADRSLADDVSWVVGANERDYHYVGAKPGRDFQVDGWADLVVARAGDACPRCADGVLKSARGIEVGQVFQLGTKYSEAMGATFSDADGVERPFIMGCYGVGVSRTVAAVIEQHADEAGVAWPVSVAPYEVAVIPVGKGEKAAALAERIHADLAVAGLETVIDDREESAGVKFADADLVGYPLQVVVGRRAGEGIVELKVRASGERSDLAAADVPAEVAGRIAQAKRALMP